MNVNIIHFISRVNLHYPIEDGYTLHAKDQYPKKRQFGIKPL